MAINAIRVLLVDDHAVVRMGFRQLLSIAPDIDLVGEADSGEKAYAEFRRLRPDILLLDLSMPGMGGMAAARHILEYEPAARILLLTIHENRTFVARALKIGVKGYLTKRCTIDELLGAIRQIHRGRTFIEEGIAQELAMQGITGESDPVDILSPREFEVFCALANGRSVQEISTTLHLSPKTVGVHRTSIMGKLKAANLAELTRMAVQAGVLEL